MKISKKTFKKIQKIDYQKPKEVILKSATTLVASEYFQTAKNPPTTNAPTLDDKNIFFQFNSFIQKL